MIALTLSLAAILVAWAGTSFGSFSSGSQLFFAQRGQALQERFVIEGAFFSNSGSNHTMVIFVRNVGQEDFTLAAIYLNDTTPNSINASGACTGSLPQRIGVGAVCEFTLTYSSSTPGSIFDITVTSERGNRAQFTIRGP
jgi:hypothetical protein